MLVVQLGDLRAGQLFMGRFFEQYGPVVRRPPLQMKQKIPTVKGSSIHLELGV
jgi:hypothetical protein